MRNQEKTHKSVDVKVPRNRLIIGSIVFITGFLMPLLVPLVTKSGLPVAWKTVLSALLLLGIPELFTLITVAILGKDGYQFLKQKALGFFKKYGPPEQVSPLRYRIGLVMFSIPFILAWLVPYAESHFHFLEDIQLYLNIGGDVLLLLSLFVLGGDFWEKIRALFIQTSDPGSHS
jgi:hypothetical protein